MAPMAPHAPLLHLASWLDATEGEHVAIAKRELCECPVLSPVIKRLYERARKVNAALPLTFQAFLDRAAADDAPAVRTKAGRIRSAVRVREGLNEQKSGAIVCKSVTDGQAQGGGNGGGVDSQRTAI